MIRPFTIVCMLMAVGSGLYLYQCKHQAQVLDRDIARTIKQTEAAREQIGMLRAEWAQLNEPERIAELARAHSALQTAKPTQFIAVNDLANRLPAAVAPVHQLETTDLPEDAEPAQPIAPTEPPPPVAVPHAASAAPAAPAAAPEPKPAHHVATAGPPAPPPAAVPPVPQASPLPASTHPLARPPAPLHALTVAAPPLAIDTVGGALPRVTRTRNRPTGDGEPALLPVAAPAPVTRAVPQPIFAAPTQAEFAPMGGSMLGGARAALPPPVPFAAR